MIEQKITEMIYNGLWFNPLTEALVAVFKNNAAICKWNCTGKTI